MEERKKFAIITAAVNAYLGEEAAGTDIITPKELVNHDDVSFWRVSGRQEIMQMRSLWQRRIVGQ